MSYHDEYLKRQQQKGYVAGTSYWDGYLERQVKRGNINIDDVVKRIGSAYEGWVSDHNQYISDNRERYSTEPSSYRSDSKEWLDGATSRRNDLIARADSIKDLIKRYGKYIDPEWSSEVNRSLDESTGAYEGIVVAARADNKYWSQWATEDDYNTAVWESDFAKVYNAGDYDSAEKMLKERAEALFSKSGGDVLDVVASDNYRKLTELEEAIEQGRLYSTYDPETYVKNELRIAEIEKELGSGIGAILKNALSEAEEVKNGGKPSDRTLLRQELEQLYAENEKYMKWADPEKYAAKNGEWHERLGATVQEIIDRASYGLLSTGEQTLELLPTAAVAAGDLYHKAYEAIADSANRADIKVGYEKSAENWEERRQSILNSITPDGSYDIVYNAPGKKSAEYVSSASLLSEYPEVQKAVLSTAEGAARLVPVIAASAAFPAVDGLKDVLFGLTAAGGGTTEAMQQGADPTTALGYGTAVGLLETEVEKLGGSVFGEFNDMLETPVGRFLNKYGLDKYASTGIGKYGYILASEGFEEDMSDVASPFLQATFGIGDAREKYFGSDWQEGWSEVAKGLPETFIVGGSVGVVMQGAQSGLVALEKLSEKKANKKYADISSEMARLNTVMIEYARAEAGKTNLSDWQEVKAYYQQGFENSLKNISEQLQKLDVHERQEVFLNAPILEVFFNSDGTVIGEFTGSDVAQAYKEAKKQSSFTSAINTYNDLESASIQKDSKNRVAKSVEDVISFVRNSVKNAVSGRLFVGKIDNQTASKIKTDTGVDVAGKSVVLSSDDLRHLFKQHGNASIEAQRGQEAITVDNFSDVMEAIFSPDTVTSSKDKSGVVSLVFTRETENRTTAVTISSDKKKALTLKSAWITKKGQHISPQSDVQAPNQTPDNELSMNAVNNSISQSGDVVNREDLSTPVGRARNYARVLKLGENGTNGLLRIADSLPEGANLGDVAQAFNVLYRAGVQGKEITAVENARVSALSPMGRLYAYRTGVVDGLMERGRNKNSPEVLQNDSIDVTINGEQSGKDISYGRQERKSKAPNIERRTARSDEKGSSGTSGKNGNGSSVQKEMQSVGRVAEGFLSQRDRRGLTQNSSKYKFNEKDFVTPSKDSVSYHAQQTLLEYGIECYVIRDDAWNRKSLGTTSNGIVYLKETIPQEHLKRIAPHESVHVMKQIGYEPYIDFLNRCSSLFNFSTEEARYLLNNSASHCKVDIFSANDTDINRVYDEFNATLFGHIAANLLDERTDWMRSAFYDFDAYVKELSDIHERFKRDMKAHRSESTNQINDVVDLDVQQAKSDQASSSEWSAERIKDGKAEKAKPISEIIEQIRHDFGINITKGHVRGKGVLGQYSRKNHGIRTKIANDLPTVAHELGHALDQRYGLTDKSKLTKEMRSELINALGDLKDSYKQNLWVSEGFAEYIRRFLQNRDEAARSYPEFTKHFLNSLSKTDRLLIDTFADEINAYYALDADTATSSIRLREEGTPDARTALEKAKEMGDDIYQAWVDANHGIRLFDEATGGDAYKLASNAAYSDAIAGQIITGDLTDANGQYVAPGLKSALEGVNIGDKRIYREFGEYLVLKHGPERLNEGMMIFADPRKNNASFMDKRVAEIENSHPEFKEAADKLYEFQKQFLKTWAVDTGLLPAEVAEAWAKRWSFYVPLNRAVGKAGTIGAKRGYANQNSTVKKAIGSGLDIVHPVDNIISNIVKMVNAGVRNNVMLEITSQADKLGADAMFLEKVPTPMKKKTADLTGVKSKLHNAFGAAGIGELLAEVERESDTQARANGQASADIRIDMGDAERYEILKGKSIQPQKIEVDPKFDIDFEYLEKNIKSEIEKPLIKKLRDLGYLKRYKTDAIEIDFEFTGGGLRKSLNSQATAYGGSFADLAKVVLNLQKLLDNSVLIEIHSDKGAGTDLENKQLVQTFVMMSAFAEETSIVPVQFEVKQFVDNANRLYLAVALTKIETGVVGNTTLDKNQASTYLLPVSRISIADFFSKVNAKDENFFKYIPDGFLNNAQIEAKKRALDKDAEKYGTKKATSSFSNGANRQNGEGIRDEGHPTDKIPQNSKNVNRENSATSKSAKSETWSKVDEIIESAIDDVLIQYGQGKAHGDVVTVLRDGKEEFWKINDALLLESLTNMSQKKMNGVMEAYAVVSRFMTSNITGNNIIWSIFSNFPRDMMTFFTYSKQKNPLKSFPAMGEAYLNKVTGGKADTKNLPYIKEYYALGGGQTSAYTADVDLAKRARRKLRNTTMLQNAAYYANPLNVLSFVSETVESGPRIATYIMMREKGMSPQEAFYESQDITVNFKRGGRLSREFNKVVPFFNASMQGLDKFRRWITCADVPKATRSKAIVGRVTMYVAVSAVLGALFYALNSRDDEDEENYRLLSNYTKNTYWNIPLGDGKYFAIPKPREIAVLSTFCETTCEYFGGNDYAYNEFGEYVADNFLPPFLSDFVTDGMDGALGSLGMIGVASDLKANKDFLGRPIESAALENYEAQDRYTRRTSQIAYWLGQAAKELGLDWSPVQIDYFFSQTLGGYWKVQKALFPVGSENVDWTLGVQNTYVKDNLYSNDIVNWLYDKADASLKAKNSHPDDISIAIDAKLDSNMKTFYSRYYALTKGHKESTESRKANRAVLDMIAGYRKAMDNGDRSPAEAAVYNLVMRINNMELLPAVMQNTVKDSEGNEIKLSSAQYVEYQTHYDSLYWEYVESNFVGEKSDSEKAVVIKQAQSVAKQRATDAALKSVGAGSSGYFDRYSGIEDKDLVTFKTQLDLSDDEDGGTSQEEVIAIIEQMVKDGLSKEDAYTLFRSRWDSDKNNPWRRYAP